MKNALRLLFFAILLASCSKKESAAPILTPKSATAADLIGSWLPIKDTLYTKENGQIKTTVVTINPNLMQFAQKGQGFLHIGISYQYYSFTYNISNGIIYTVFQDTSGPDAYHLLAISPARLVLRVIWLTGENEMYEDAEYTKE
jgi:hypothetical protein